MSKTINAPSGNGSPGASPVKAIGAPGGFKRMASGDPLTARAGPVGLSSAKKDLVKFSVRAQNFILQKELASKSTIGYDDNSVTGIGKSGPLNLDSYLDDTVSRP